MTPHIPTMASLCRSVGRRGQWKAGWMKGLIGLTQAGRTQGRDLAGPRRLLPQPQAQQCQEASGPCPQLARESDILLIDPSHPGHSAHLLNSPAPAPHCPDPNAGTQDPLTSQRPSFPTPPAVGISKGSQEVVPAHSVADPSLVPKSESSSSFTQTASPP